MADYMKFEFKLQITEREMEANLSGSCRKERAAFPEVLIFTHVVFPIGFITFNFQRQKQQENSQYAN